MTDVSLVMRLVNQVAAPAKQITRDIKSVTGSIGELEQSMRQIDRLNSLGGKLQGAGGWLTGVGAAMGTLTFAPAFDAAALRDGLAHVATLAGAEFGSIRDEYTDMILALSRETGASGEELVKALEHGLKSGLNLEEATRYMDGVAKAAVAGGTELSKVMELTTAVSQNYRLEMLDSLRLQDTLFTSLSKGGAVYEDLAAGIGQILPQAAAAGVSVQNVTAALMQFRQSGAPMERVVSGVGAAITGLSAPSARAAAAIRGLGVDVSKAALAEGDLIGVMELLREGLQGLSDAERTLKINQIFEDAAAREFARDYIASADAYKALTLEVINSNGAMEKSFETARSNAAGSVRELLSSFKNLKETLGTSVLPLFDLGIKGLTKMVRGVSAFAAENKTLTRVIMSVAGVSSILLTAFGSLLLGVGTGIKLWASLKTGLAVLTPVIKVLTVATHGFGRALMLNPVGLIITAVGLLVVGLIALQKRFNIFGKLFDHKGLFKGLAPAVKPLLDIFKELWGAVRELGRALAPIFAPLMAPVQKLVAWLGTLRGETEEMTAAGEMAGKALGIAFKVMSTPLRGLVELITLIVQGITKVVEFGQYIADGGLTKSLTSFADRLNPVNNIRNFFNRDAGGELVAAAAGAGADNRQIDQSITIQMTSNNAGSAGPGMMQQDIRDMVDRAGQELRRRNRGRY